MSKNKKNIYEQKAKQKSLLGLGSTSAAVETKGNIKNTLAFTGRDILIGGLGGSLAGALAGRSSLLIGAVVTGAGHFFGSPGAAMFGVGMMASGGYQTISGMNGVEKDGLEGVKERFKNFQNNLKRQLFLDKIKPKKKEAATTEESTNGMGSVQYFDHSEKVEGLDYTEANRIEEQIKESARQFEAKNSVGEVDSTDGVEGTDGVDGKEDMDGTDGVEGIEDRIL
jgi:hypothetical protein